MSPKRILDYLFPSRINRRNLIEWADRRYIAPSPPHIKRSVLLRFGIPDGIWVESGTFLGDTTDLLSQNCTMVYSIEPEPSLYKKACLRFAKQANVEILHGTSETQLPNLLTRLSGNVSFWLDGHYSAGITFKGFQETPIIEELRAIADALPRLGSVNVLIDDIRCFEPSLPQNAGYPTRNFLVDWANTNGLTWHIEHDIFIAKKQ